MARTAGGPGRWRWRHLLTAPHRVAFFGAGTLLCVAATWWLAALLAVPLGRPWTWQVAPALAHGAVMTFGFLPLFIGGFLFTGGPRWLGQPVPPGRSLAGPVATQVGAGLFLLLGLHVDAALAAVALGISACAGGVLWARFVRMLIRSTVADRMHPLLIAVALAVVLAAQCAAAVALFTGQDPVLRAAVHLALWTGLGGTFAVAAHRMVPFFNAPAWPALDARVPQWMLVVLCTAFSFEGVGAALATLGPDGLVVGILVVRTIVDLAAGALVGLAAWRWARLPQVAPRLPRMLHVGFTWLALAWLLSALSQLLLLVTDGRAGLGSGPLHALTLGYFGSTLLAMVSRVVAGHGGRTVVADDLLWGLFWLLQVATATRVAASLPGAPSWLLVLAGMGWAAALIAWCLRHAAWLGRGG